ncbi:MotE family protein [Sneathiella sp.]|uniref:MotE family protein n=1 Tax=Sneathiella sp. TaxID=1964365 RepID=UPI002FE0FE33
MMTKIRILPMMVIALLLIFGVKLSAVWTDAQGVFFDVRVAEVQASEKGAAAEGAAENAAAQASAATSEAGDASAAAPVRESVIAAIDPAVSSGFTKSEVEVLERLAQRRAELDRRAEELDMRDNLLKATETRIDDKIAKLREMEETLNGLLRLHDEEKRAQMESLVKIYEKMKPKDAARIFNNLDMDILIDVASNIKEAKMASILAEMNSARANKLTVELATRQQLPKVEESKG